MSLPEDFLTQLEQYEELSQRERDVFLEMFGRGKSRVQVAQYLNISESALSTCLTGIYNKFRISGSGPIKENRLREYLTKRCLQPKSSGFSTSDDLERGIDTLVQEIREKVKPNIRERCGTMRVLDMNQPIELTGERGIYTNVNILEKITGRRRLDIAELLQNCDPEDFERFGLNKVTEKRVPGLEAVQHYRKLMVLGKPGAGKTTFLKYLAMQCIEGEFQAKRVPVFITLKDFAETPNQPSLLEFISQLFDSYGVAATQILELLKRGRTLILLDGLDEVTEEDSKRVFRQIETFSNQFFFSNEFKSDRSSYLKDRNKKLEELERCKTSKERGYSRRADILKFPDISKHPDQGFEFLSHKFPEKIYTNQFVITCRIAAKEYIFERFTEVEVADFDWKQIKIFGQNWFRQSDPIKASRFIQKLEENEPIRELASSPLLLTLLCLMFGETADFPANRSELYKEGLDVLLKKWDAKRNVQRDQVYKNLSVQRKEDLLSQIALTTFEHKDYFFKQKTAEAYIVDFIRNLRDADPDPKVLGLDSEAVLKSIEAQHGLLVERAKGIYSFSHLTFQEYFAARELVANSALEKLVEHVTEKRWREVFLLTAGMLRNADELMQLMKQKIDGLVGQHEKLQQFLAWVNQRSNSYQVSHKSAVRAAYLIHLITRTRFLNINTDLVFSLNRSVAVLLERTHDLAQDFNNTFVSVRALAAELAPKLDGFSELTCACNFICNIVASDLDFAFNSKLQRKLQELKNQLPDISYKNLSENVYRNDNLSEHVAIIKQWWQTNELAWIEQLKPVVVEYRELEYDWQFINSQKKLLQQYYDANKLLIDCLNSDCYVSREVRQEIKDTLLLPMSEIENRQQDRVC